MDRRLTFADETKTGRYSDAYRRIGRATIAVQAEDPGGFEWVLQLSQDFLPRGMEPKSEIVLRLMSSNERARAHVLKRIADYTVVIIDFSTYTRDLISGMVEKLAPNLPPTIDPLDFMKSESFPDEIAKAVLTHAREHAIERSAIRSIERLLMEAIDDAFIPRGSDGELFDRHVLCKMDDEKFRELVARFSLALAEALEPKRQASALFDAIRGTGVLRPGYVAFLTLRDPLEAEKTYDTGAGDVFSMLAEAHSHLINDLQIAANDNFYGTLRPGRVRQEDSRKYLGIQAADIAAAVAREEFEKFPRQTRFGAHAVRQIFSKVMLNSSFL